MNIHPAQSYEAKIECEQILSVKANFMSSQDSKPLLSFKQDAMTGGYKLTFGYVKIPKSVFFDCLMIFPDMDVMEKIDHIKEVHKWKGLTQKEIDKLTKENPNMNKEEIEQTAEDNLLYTGHSLFSFLLPNDFEYHCQNKICPLGNPLLITRGVLLSGTLNKVAIGNSSGSLIHHLFKDYSPQVALDFVSYYQMLINHWLIHYGFSIGLEDCVAHKTDMIENEINNCLLEAEAVMKTEKDPEVSEFRVSNILNKATTLGQKIAKEALDPTNNLVSMIRSGAKGNDFNVTQITGLVGQQCVSAARIPKLFKGRTLPHFCKDTYASSSVDILSMNLEYDVSKIVESRGFVKNSYYKGLTPTEFFFHACGGREGVIDTACKSVVYETELLIMEDGKMKHIKIGEWVDELMKNSKNIEEEDDENRELLELNNEVYIPTTDLKGNISWGQITHVTRHDPTENMYEIKTLSGRDVTVTDSHSLLIWNDIKQEFERVKPQYISVGSFVPTTSKLVEPPVSVSTHTFQDGLIYGEKINYEIETEYLSYNKEFIRGLLTSYFTQKAFITKTVNIQSIHSKLLHDINICLSMFGIFGKIVDNTYLEIDATEFKREIKLLDEEKQKQVETLERKNEFKLNNDVVLDKIVSINKVEIKHNKVYDLTVPSTLNFGLYNGLHVVDTAKTGYIQRKMVKILEDIHFNYNNMVVNNFNQILEFSYGDDNMDISKLIKTNYGYSFIDVAHTTDILNKNNEWKNRNKLK